MLSPSFETKQDVINAEYVFIPAKVIEYVKNEKGVVIGKIQRVDVSGGNSFGYDWAIGAFKDEKRIAQYGTSIEVYIEQATNKGGSKGAVYTNVMSKEEYEKAVTCAKLAIWEGEEL